MYTWAAFLHIVLAMFWIGGMLFTVAVLVPATRKKLADQKTLLFTELGSRFSRISWILFPLLLLTGVLALLGRGISVETLLSIDFWETEYGSILFKKLHVFGLVLIISGIHDFWLGPKAVELIEENSNTKTISQFRGAARWAGRLNLVLGLIIVFYAVSLIRW